MCERVTMTYMSILIRLGVDFVDWHLAVPLRRWSCGRWHCRTLYAMLGYLHPLWTSGRWTVEFPRLRGVFVNKIKIKIRNKIKKRGKEERIKMRFMTKSRKGWAGRLEAPREHVHARVPKSLQQPHFWSISWRGTNRQHTHTHTLSTCRSAASFFKSNQSRELEADAF